MNYFGSQHKALPHGKVSLSGRGRGYSFCMCGLLIPTILFVVEPKKASCIKKALAYKISHCNTLYVNFIRGYQSSQVQENCGQPSFTPLFLALMESWTSSFRIGTVQPESLIWGHPPHVCTISHVHAENGQKNISNCWNDCSAVLLNSCMHLYT